MIESRFWLDTPASDVDAALTALKVPVALIEVSGNNFSIVAANESMLSYYGLTGEMLEAVRERPIDDWLEGTDPRQATYLRRALQNYRRCVHSRADVEVENSFLDSDGNLTWSANKMVPIFRDGKVCRILVTVIDVSYKYQRSLTPDGGNLSMCGWCSSKIREGDEDSWTPIDQYLVNKHDYAISHGICDTCLNDMQGTSLSQQEVVLDDRLSYRFDFRNQLVHALIKGGVDFEIVRDFWDDLAGNLNYSHYDIMYDMSQTDTHLSNQDVRDLVTYTKRYEQQFNGIRMAVIVKDDVDFGLTRMADSLPGGPGINLRPFWDEAEGAEWLNS